MLHDFLLLTYLRLSSILGLHWYLHSDLDDALHLMKAKLLEFFLRFPPALDGCPALPAAAAGAALAAFLSQGFSRAASSRTKGAD